MCAICFDLDGTLIDPKVGIIKSIRHALEANGFETSPYDEDYYFCIGPPLLDSFGKLTGSPARSEKLLATYRERFQAKGIYENDLYPGIVELLKKLKADNRPLYLTTSKPEVYAQAILDHLDISQYFDCVYGSELGGARSDKTELLEWVVTQENLKREKTYMVGDRKYDTIGARNNGLKSVAVLYGYGTSEELSEALPNKICHAVNEIYDALAMG